MATVSFTGVGVDMRYEDEGYHIPEFQAFLALLDTFQPVREVVLVNTDTMYRVTQYDALNLAVTTTIEGNLPAASISAMQVDALALSLRITGALQVDRVTERLNGTITGIVASGSTGQAARITGLDDYVSISLSGGSFEDQLPDDADMFAGADRIDADSGADVLLGYAGKDTISGAGGDDTLQGGAGDDALDGDAGDDVLDGGRGNDTLDGGDGVDLASYRGAAAGVRVDLATLAAQDTGGAGIDLLRGIEGVLGSDFADQLLGGTGGDTLAAYSGNDTLAGAGGRDSLDGHAGHDALDGGGGADTLAGGKGDDSLYGGNGTDALQGGSGNDALNGGARSDTLAGGAGSDTLTGGDGPDRFVFDARLSARTNVDTITRFEHGTDVLVLDDDAFSALDAAASPVLLRDQFHAAPGARAAHDADDRIVYDSASGSLYYDADGLGGVAAVRFAVLGTTAHPTVSAGDFLVVG